jgi:hypothetical protein
MTDCVLALRYCAQANCSDNQARWQQQAFFVFDFRRGYTAVGDRAAIN